MAPTLWTRRRFLRAGAIGVLGGLSLAYVAEALGVSFAQRKPLAYPIPGAVDPDPRLSFRSRPDLTVHPVAVLTAAEGVGEGHVFLTPGVDGGHSDGPLIIDDRGDPVWIHPITTGAATNFRVQQYSDRPVLTWWEGDYVQIWGQGECVIVDAAYSEIARIQAANGHRYDLHAFHITPQDTALVTVYAPVPNATTSRGQPVVEGIIQEIDIATGRLVWDWHSYGAVELSESYFPVPTDATQPYDYFHVNSIDITPDGHLLISARHTWTVYKIDRMSGKILWRLGGRRSDFAIASDASFSWQHDARSYPDGTVTLFDDEAPPTPSRGLRVQVDEVAKTVSLVRAYAHPGVLSSSTRGNVQALPNGNVFVGWGAASFASEFGPAGDLRFDLGLWPGLVSYRAFRCPWQGQPTDRPAVAVERSASGGTVVYASWNGATEVARWQIMAGATDSDLHSVASVPRSGFETSVELSSAWPLVAAQALDASGAVLGTSPTHRVAV